MNISFTVCPMLPISTLSTPQNLCKLQEIKKEKKKEKIPNNQFENFILKSFSSLSFSNFPTSMNGYHETILQCNTWSNQGKINRFDFDNEPDEKRLKRKEEKNKRKYRNRTFMGAIKWPISRPHFNFICTCYYWITLINGWPSIRMLPTKSIILKITTSFTRTPCLVFYGYILCSTKTEKGKRKSKKNNNNRKTVWKWQMFQLLSFHYFPNRNCVVHQMKWRKAPMNSYCWCRLYMV